MSWRIATLCTSHTYPDCLRISQRVCTAAALDRGNDPIPSGCRRAYVA